MRKEIPEWAEQIVSEVAKAYGVRTPPVKWQEVPRRSTSGNTSLIGSASLLAPTSKIKK